MQVLGKRSFGAQIVAKDPSSGLKEWLDTCSDGRHERQLSTEESSYLQDFLDHYEGRKFKYAVNDNRITVWLPTAVHDSITDPFIECWYEAIFNGHLPREFKSLFEIPASREFNGFPPQRRQLTTRKKIPDLAIRLKTREFPSVVFEIGFSQTWQELLEVVRTWLVGAEQGNCRLVIIIKFDEEKTPLQRGIAPQNRGGGEDITGEDFGPCFIGGEAFVGKITADVEVWNYSQDIEERIRRAKDGRHVNECNQHFTLIPPDDGVQTIRLLFTDLFGGETPGNLNWDGQQFWEFPLDLYRKEIKESIKSLAKSKKRDFVCKQSDDDGDAEFQPLGRFVTLNPLHWLSNSVGSSYFNLRSYNSEYSQ